ncbi:uncharacterized protein DEA37_0003926 [Paragonimus westermani]|uniref:Uncharacterized protein n=1 Tax=Paragonimus westermani TaxID=34504 RepID=A0A5J4P2T8_9TREM|nr:uncharacterized protein DEA37_0003926 [Paragonimus westermani]
MLLHGIQRTGLITVAFQILISSIESYFFFHT